MEVMVERCCGIDVHQKSIVCCILDGPLDTSRPKKFIQSFGTSTPELRNALEWLEEHQVTEVFMESTGQYWIPVFNIFSEGSFNQVLANPQRIKNVPGRKTDVKDAEWLAQLGRCGLVSASYIPNDEVLGLRFMTRRRQSYTQKRTQTKNEIHNILQRSNIKLTSYLSDIFSKTGQALLSLFFTGEPITIERILPCMFGHTLKASAEDFLKALDGKMSRVDRQLLEYSLEEYQFFTQKIERLTEDIEEYILEHFPIEYGLLLEIPGIKENGAAIILGEIGPDVTAFPTAGHLAVWAGLAPGKNESAERKKPARTTKGNKYLKTCLIIGGGIAGRSKEPAFNLLYRRISNKGSRMKACVACGHKILRIVYKVLDEKIHYDTEKALGLRQQSLVHN